MEGHAYGGPDLCLCGNTLCRPLHTIRDSVPLKYRYQTHSRTESRPELCPFGKQATAGTQARPITIYTRDTYMPTSTRAQEPKPILVGEQNPYGSDPYYVLYPAPDGCSGHRLCCRILGMHRRTYLETFERVNLCDGPWSVRDARDRATEVSQLSSRKIIVLGTKVATAFNLKYCRFSQIGKSILILPHPSGRCRTWNNPGAFRQAREAVAAFLPEIAHLLGVNDHGDSECPGEPPEAGVEAATGDTPPE